MIREMIIFLETGIKYSRSFGKLNILHEKDVEISKNEIREY